MPGDRLNYRSLLVFLGILMLAIVMRTAHIGAGPIQVDEIHWKDRSERVWRLLRAGKYSVATNEPGHPGVPPALAMAFAQGAAGKLNALRGLNPGDAGYVDKYDSSRFGAGFVSALVVLVSALSVFTVIGIPLATIYSLLLAFDPNLVGFARLAHLDAVMAVFSTAALFLYFFAVEKKSLGLKVGAGAMWGLALLTKPTAVALIPAFLVYKIIRRWIVPCRDDRGERAIIAWSDLWAVISGHLIFAALYTRMWSHNSLYRTQLHVVSGLADLIYGAGELLRASPLIAGALGIVLILGIRAQIRQPIVDRQRVSRSVALQLSILVAIIFFALWLTPNVLENFARFWTRVSGLHSVTHKAVGIVDSGPPPGYLRLWTSRLPSFLLFGFALGLFGMLRDLKKVRDGLIPPEARDRALLSLLFFVAILFWTTLLSTSPKQAFRYLLPVVPAAIFIGVVGIGECLNFVDKYRRRISRAALYQVVAVFLGVFEAVWSYRLFPDNLFFYNSLSGGIHRATERGGMVPTAGTPDLIRYLRDSAIASGNQRTVSVLGDVDPFIADYKHRYVEERPWIRFVMERNALSEESLVVMPTLADRMKLNPSYDWDALPSELQYRIEDEILLTLVQLPLPTYEKPVRESLVNWYRNTGDVRSADTMGVSGAAFPATVIARPGVNKRGFLFFGEGFRFVQGRFELRFRAAAVGGKIVDPALPVFDFHLGSACGGAIQAAELGENSYSTILRQCVFDTPGYRQFRGTWFGKQGLAFESIEIVAIP